MRISGKLAARCDTPVRAQPPVIGRGLFIGRIASGASRAPAELTPLLTGAPFLRMASRHAVMSRARPRTGCEPVHRPGRCLRVEPMAIRSVEVLRCEAVRVVMWSSLLGTFDGLASSRPSYMVEPMDLDWVPNLAVYVVIGVLFAVTILHTGRGRWRG